jgi:uncharacterized delta-60 repeat protein
MVRLLAVVVVLAWQLAVAVPAQARPGDLDRGFGGDGTVTTDFPGVARALVVQGRKLVAAGLAFSSETSDDFGLARYNSNGALDRSFGTGGKVTTNITGSGSPDEANALAQQADGKLVAAGGTDAFATGSDFALARYNPDGTLDPSFGTGGMVTTGLELAFALVVQADGKLVAAGVAGQDFGLARYNPNGTLDASFGTGGTVTTDFAGDSDAAHALAVQPDGKLVAAGEAGPCCDFALARYRTR